jgi:predicted outer membrane repeat protein
VTGNPERNKLSLTSVILENIKSTITMFKRTSSYKIAGVLIILAFNCTCVFAGKIIYVDDDANGVNDGSSWQNAYKYLQDALADANSFEKPVEIRVAQGIYKPDKGLNQTAGNRNASFNLIDNVTLSGGYAGVTESEPNEQNIEKYETILSGDLAGDDVESENPMISSISRRENSIHIINNNKTAILYGLTITRGNAHSENGGGIYNDTGNLTLRNCNICNNTSDSGGGIYNTNGSLNIQDCTIKGNSTVFTGGGIFKYQGSVDMTNCIFEENSANYSGGGLCNLRGSFNLNNCVFNKNFTLDDEYGSGGAIYNYGSSGPPNLNKQKLIDCTFTENSAPFMGGGIYNTETELFLSNCKFIRNTTSSGGGLYNYYGNSVLNNCSFIGNLAARHGGGIYNGNNCMISLNNCCFCGNQALQNGGGICYLTINRVYTNTILNNCVLFGNKAGNLGGGIFCSGRLEPLVSNTIIWLNTALQGNQIALLVLGFSYCSPTFKYNNIQGGLSEIYQEYEENIIEWKDSNVDVDPLFANPGYWDPNGTPDYLNDDFWVDGDYHLKSQAGRFDLNTQTWIQDDETSPCIDTGDPNSPIGLEPFPNGGRINMGAYGGTSEASKSYFGKPVCTTIVAGDINGDCKVDVLDFEIMLLHWLEEH